MTSPPVPLSPSLRSGRAVPERGNPLTAMATTLLISDHALSRFVERYAETDGLESDAYRGLLLAELERGVSFGGQVGNDALYLLPCGLVAAIAFQDGRG